MFTIIPITRISHIMSDNISNHIQKTCLYFLQQSLVTWCREHTTGHKHSRPVYYKGFSCHLTPLISTHGEHQGLLIEHQRYSGDELLVWVALSLVLRQFISNGIMTCQFCRDTTLQKLVRLLRSAMDTKFPFMGNNVCSTVQSSRTNTLTNTISHI